LHADWLLSNFGRRKAGAIAKNKKFVAEGKGRRSQWEALSGQVYHGSDEFLVDAREAVEGDAPLSEVPRVQQRPLPASIGIESVAQRGDSQSVPE
jgi:hypothetical protein